MNIVHLGEITLQKAQLLEGKRTPWSTGSKASATGEFLTRRINAPGNDGRAEILVGQNARNRETWRAAGVIRFTTRACGPYRWAR